MKLPDAALHTTPEMRALLTALGSANGDTRYVGGWVRDTLLGLVVSDVDLATRLAPDDVLDRVRGAGIKAVPTGIAHGTITAVLPSGPVEVTTLRRDIATDGRHATIAYTGDWKEDAARRDFTINAFSADPESGEIFDYFGGQQDLAARVVRFIGDPLVRIAEDHLRILRFFRFHARFGAGAPDEAALAACAARANDLMALSRERVADELLKILALPDPSPTLGLMIDHGILKPVLPEIASSGVDALAALIAREAEAGIDGHPLRRLAALLAPDPALATSVAGRLRLSKKATRRLAAAAGRVHGDGAVPKQLAYKLGRDEAVDRLLLGDGAPRAALATLKDWEKPRLAIGGGDLIAMGLKPGPAVARTLYAVEAEWAANGFSSDSEEVRRIARRHVDQTLRDRQ